MYTAIGTHEQREALIPILTDLDIGVGVFFAAAYMVRLAKLMSDANLTDQTAKDAEDLADKSSSGKSTGPSLGYIILAIRLMVFVSQVLDDPLVRYCTKSYLELRGAALLARMSRVIWRPDCRIR